MRFPLQVIEAMRAAWPKEKPLTMRVSIKDWIDGGWDVDDSIAYALAAKERGVDMIHCTSGGFDGAAVKPGAHYQVELAAAVKQGAGIPAMAVGLITDPAAAERVLQEGAADMIALARPALDDPNWAVHAARTLDHDYALWPKQVGYAIRAKDKILGLMQ
jgi:2,4-dienoyl-CoA reductase-like NADH-dependent reductase (Old Yellow Enzyme family)